MHPDKPNLAKHLGQANGFAYPSKGDYSEAKEMLNNFSWNIGEYEKKYLNMMIESYLAKEPMPARDFTESRFVLLAVKAEYDNTYS